MSDEQQAVEQTEVADTAQEQASEELVSMPRPAFNARLEQAERAALKKLGVESPDDIIALRQRLAELEDASKSEDQRRQEQAERQATELEEARRLLAEREQQVADLERRAAFVEAAVVAGIPADRIGDAYRLAEWGDESDPAKVLSDLLTAKPWLAGVVEDPAQARAATTRGASGRTNGVNPPGQPEKVAQWSEMLRIPQPKEG